MKKPKKFLKVGIIINHCQGDQALNYRVVQNFPNLAQK